LIRLEIEKAKKRLEIREGKSIKDALKKNDKDLLKNAVAAKVIEGNKKSYISDIVDIDFKPENDLKIDLVYENDPIALDILNHSTAHIMASAIKKVFPDARFAIGPAIEKGFYYDFETKEDVGEEDLKKIEKEMKRLIKRNTSFLREDVSKEKALEIFSKNPYKIELIEDLEGNISIYTSEDFIDLCSGPHIPNAGYIGGFKLLSLAGAYWRGDEKNKMLTRIYGTSFYTPEDLKLYLDRMELAKRSDHRKLGKELDLFSFCDDAPGFAFFHPKGMVLQNTILDYWRQEHKKEGYDEIKTPLILSNNLWKISGHWDHYRENMYFVKIDENDFAVKPMNCVGAMMVYKSNQHSYREFPIRFAEIGTVHRHEKSGVLHGLFRVRTFTQDDAHIFCLDEQLKPEIAKIIGMIERMYKVFGFKQYHLELSTRPEDRIGSDKMWDNAENILSEVMKEKGLDFKINEGDGAFYGPKIDFHIRDCLDRTWQCATVQLDFSMPEKFDIEYAGEDNNKHRPAMIHRVVLGSIERFIGILTEHYGGNFPPWLAPVQLVVLPISEKFSDYSRKVFERLKSNGFRVEIDERVESLNKKIRQSEMNKIPYMVIIGQKELDSDTVTVRKKTGGDIKNISIEEFMCMVEEIVSSKKIES